MHVFAARGVYFTERCEQQEESDVFGALSGFGLDSVLGSLDLPSGTGLTNQLGIAGVQNIPEGWDDDGAVGRGEGDDWEDEITAELANEDTTLPDASIVKAEEPLFDGAMLFPMKERRVRVVRRLVERPKTVYERFPGFEKDRVLAFTEMFQGHATMKSRVSKRPFHGEFSSSNSMHG
jgi:transcription initiation factor TFIID subunit 1, fungi type